MRDTSWNARLSAVLLMVAATIGLVAVSDPANASPADPGAAYLLGLGVMGTLWVLGTRWLSLSRTSPVAWLHSPVLITGYVLLLVVIPGFSIFLFPGTLNASGLVRYEYLTWGVLLMAAGLLGLWGGYAVGMIGLRPLRSLAALQRHPISPTAVMGLYAITILARLVRIVVVGIAYNSDVTRWGAAAAFDQWISYLESMRYLVLGIVGIQVLRGNWPRHLLLTVLGLEVVFAFISGFMKPLLWLIVVLAAAASCAGVELRKYSRYLLPIGLASIFIVPVAQAIRYSTLHRALDTRSPMAVLQSAWEVLRNLWYTGSDAGLTAFFEYVPARLGFVAYMPGLAMSRTPEKIPYLGFERLLEIPLYLLPRSIWADKPILSRSRWFSVQYLDMPYETQSSTAITIFGESYLFGGWTTTLIGLFLLGLLLAFVFQNTVGVGLASIYLALLPGLMDVESELTTKVISLVQGPILLFVVYLALIQASRFLGTREGVPPAGPPPRTS